MLVSQALSQMGFNISTYSSRGGSEMCIRDRGKCGVFHFRDRNQGSCYRSLKACVLFCRTAPCFFHSTLQFCCCLLNLCAVYNLDILLIDADQSK